MFDIVDLMIGIGIFIVCSLVIGVALTLLNEDWKNHFRRK